MRYRFVPSVTAAIALSFLVASAASNVLSPTRATALIGWYGTFNGLATTALFVALFIVAERVFAGGQERIRPLIAGVSSSAVVLTLYVLAQWLHLDPIHWAQASGAAPTARYFGTLGNADFAGGLLGITFPFVLLCYRRSRTSTTRALVAVWGVAQLGALWLTSARNGILGSAAALAVCLYVYRRELPTWLRRAILVVVIAVVALGALVVFRSLGRPPSPTASASILRTETIRVRGYWWIAGLRVFVHHPFFGTGPDTFGTEFLRYLPRAAAPIGDAVLASQPHNVYVDLLATRGIFGTATYLAVVGAVLLGAWRRLRSAGEREREVVVVLTASVVGALVANLVSVEVIPVAAYTWIVLGALVAQTSGAPPVKARRARPVVVGVVALAILIAVAGVFPLRADHAAHSAGRLVSAGGSADQIEPQLLAAITSQPLEATYRAAMGDYLRGRGLADHDPSELDSAFERYRQAHGLQPRFDLWMIALGATAGDLAHLKQAEGWFARAKAVAPTDWRVPDAYGDMLIGRLQATRRLRFACEAQAQYQRAAELQPGEPRSYVGLARIAIFLGDTSTAQYRLKVALTLDPTDAAASELSNALGSRPSNPRTVRHC